MNENAGDFFFFIKNSSIFPASVLRIGYTFTVVRAILARQEETLASQIVQNLDRSSPCHPTARKITRGNNQSKHKKHQAHVTRR